MENVITYVGVDAHKKDLFIAMLVGNQATPVTWQQPNEPNAIRRLVRKLEREAPGTNRGPLPLPASGAEPPSANPRAAARPVSARRGDWS